MVSRVVIIIIIIATVIATKVGVTGILIYEVKLTIENASNSIHTSYIFYWSVFEYLISTLTYDVFVPSSVEPLNKVLNIPSSPST